jgi:carboxyl-terminal processing protease
LSQFQERTVDDFVAKVDQTTRRTQAQKGWCWTCAMTCGLLDAAVAISAAFLPENVTAVSTNSNWLRANLRTKPRRVLRRNGPDPLKPYLWSLKSVLLVLLMKVPLLPAKLSLVPLQDQTRHHHGHANLQALVCPLCALWGPDTGIKLTTHVIITRPAASPFRPASCPTL